VPVQAVLVGVTAIVFGVLLHRTIIGRAAIAIGWSAEGARFAGIPVARRLALLYIASGLISGIAGILYVARIGQAKADAGSGYELLAIAAVVLGGTSITGGRGSVPGTLLGLAGIVVLRTGLRLSDLPAELAGVLTGALLLVSLAATAGETAAFARRIRRPPDAIDPAPGSHGRLAFTMRNSQLAVLCAAVLGAALIVASSNWWLARSIEHLRSGSGPAEREAAGAAEPGGGSGTITVAMMPKAKGDPYFVSCRKGAEEAAKELGVTLIWDGPTDLDPARQNEVVESWITRGVDVIAVSVENKASISTALRQARERGIKVVAWDADAEPDARDVFINQATPAGIAEVLTDRTVALLGGKGDFAIVTASLSAANQNEWLAHIRTRLKERYPDVHLVAVQPSDGDRDRAFTETQNILKVYPAVRVIMGIASPAVPGIAEAVRQSGRTDVKVTGLSLPNMCKPFVHAGVIDSIVLWNTVDLGYLTVRAARALVTGDLKPGKSEDLAAGRLGRVVVRRDQVLLGKPFVFTRANIDGFDF
jgi:rhamnose transport system permease protein